MMPSTDPRPMVAKKLEMQRRFLNWLSWGVGIGLVGVIVALAFIYTSRAVEGALPFVLIFSLVLVISATSWLLARRAARRQECLADHVRSRLPEMLALRSTPVLTLEGRLFVDQARGEAYAFQIPRYSRFGNAPAPVIDVWREAPDGLVVGNDAGEIALGARLGGPGLRRALLHAALAWYGLALFALGLFGLVIALVGLTERPGLQRQVERAEATRAWPRVSAVVTGTSVSEVQVRQGRGHVAAWVPDVRYEYWIDGRRYEGSRRVVFDEPQPTRELAAQVSTAFVPGTAITVSVDPQQAGESVIEPGAPAGLRRAIEDADRFVAITSALGLLIVGVLVGWAEWQRRQGRRLDAEIRNRVATPLL